MMKSILLYNTKKLPLLINNIISWLFDIYRISYALAAEIGISSELYDEVLDNVDRANAMVKEMQSVPNSHVHLMTPQESLKSQSDDEQRVIVLHKYPIEV